MRRLTEHERIALRQFGPPGEGPVPDHVFDELIALGWGRWERDPDEPRHGVWTVTAAGRAALALDAAARTT